MTDIALRQIRAVIAVCEEGSFTRAAAREHATQSGISQHVSAAERSLGLKLFERSSTGVAPTPAGLRFYKRCVEAVGMLATAGEEARAIAGLVSGELRIGLRHAEPHARSRRRVRNLLECGADETSKSRRHRRDGKGVAHVGGPMRTSTRLSGWK